MATQLRRPPERASDARAEDERQRQGACPHAAASPRADLLRLYEQMVLLRRFELAAQIACRKGETPGFLHLYIGEEATAVGVCAHLRPTDWITSHASRPRPRAGQGHGARAR